MIAKPTLLKLALALLSAVLLVILSNVFLQLAPLSRVPVNLATFAVMLAGALLGASYGFFSVLSVVLLTAVGLPLLGQQGGMDLLLGAQGGFLWMYPVCAGLLGLAVSRITGRDLASVGLLFLAAFGLGSLLDYTTGLLWFAHLQHVSLVQAWQSACIPYLVGDVLKSLAVAVIAWPLRPRGKGKRKRS
ncbi:biotin transporter BioY [Tumebacillus permanentifrigoris]|uniref:Biotin transporter n=1 Tax=Tumebacillus permanentifrigoris TaxID=378543 RepID=A0A316DDQ0_9BACL|nr:biotin transporter BioY [Tumebacillus permanentifrigoris]PWK14920.1 biotin transport system substrate-specific component [Tumebacillus permanentifrigoris]